MYSVVFQKRVLFNSVPHENDLFGVSPVYDDGELSNGDVNHRYLLL